jgi:hypothetical protein
MKTSLFLHLLFAVVAFGKLRCNIESNKSPEEIKIKCVDDNHNIDYIRGQRVSKSTEKTVDLVRLELFEFDKNPNSVHYSTDKVSWTTSKVGTTVIKPEQQSLKSDRHEYTFSFNNISMEGNISVIYISPFIYQMIQCQ